MKKEYVAPELCQRMVAQDLSIASNDASRDNEIKLHGEEPDPYA